jgi:hypothetical protein
MGRRRNPTPEELADELAQAEELSELVTKGVVDFSSSADRLRMRCIDFCDDEQAAAWRQALRQLANKDDPSIEGILRFLNLGKPISERLAAALAHLLRGGVVIPIEGEQPKDLDSLPERLGEMVVEKWPNPRFRKRPPHRPSNPESWRKVHEAAAEVARRRADGSSDTDTVLIEKATAKHKARRERVQLAYKARTLETSRNKKIPK